VNFAIRGRSLEGDRGALGAPASAIAGVIGRDRAHFFAVASLTGEIATG
jgi:hypothetical protein